MKRPLLFTLFGALYLFIGALSVLKVGAAWHFAGAFAWTSVAYASMSFLVSYGFFSAQRWIYPALGLNWAATTAYMAVKLALHMPAGAELALHALAFGVNTAVLISVYLFRKKLIRSKKSSYAGSAFIALWAGMLCYNLLATFS